MYDTSTSSKPWRVSRQRHPALRVQPRVLVAEDDPEMRRLVADALRQDGYEVFEAADGNGLLVHVTAQAHTGTRFDLIISDIRMPVCSGLQILEALRSASWTVPVILMTAFCDDATRAKAEALGGVLFDKPFALDDLRTAVLNLLPMA